MRTLRAKQTTVEQARSKERLTLTWLIAAVHPQDDNMGTFLFTLFDEQSETVMELFAGVDCHA